MEAGLRVEVLMPWRLVMHVVANVDLLEVRDELQDLAIDARGQAIHARILSFDPFFFNTHTHAPLEMAIYSTRSKFGVIWSKGGNTEDVETCSCIPSLTITRADHSEA